MAPKYQSAARIYLPCTKPDSFPADRAERCENAHLSSLPVPFHGVGYGMSLLLAVRKETVEHDTDPVHQVQ